MKVKSLVVAAALLASAVVPFLAPISRVSAVGIQPVHICKYNGRYIGGTLYYGLRGSLNNSTPYSSYRGMAYGSGSGFTEQTGTTLRPNGSSTVYFGTVASSRYVYRLIGSGTEYAGQAGKLVSC